MTPTTLAADAAQALQGVTDLIARLNADKQPYAYGRLVTFKASQLELEAAAALTALSERNANLAAQVAELTRERDDALSAARQRGKLREATLATLRGVSADLEAAEAKVARLEGALVALEWFSETSAANAVAAKKHLDELNKGAALTDGMLE
jgi:hypothetical protein